MVLVCLDDDDRVLLVRRSEYVVYPGRFTATLSGNCELAVREGHPADHDENGLRLPVSDGYCPGSRSSAWKVRHIPL